MCVCWLVYTHTSVIVFNIIGRTNASYYLHLRLEPRPTWLSLTFLPPAQLFTPFLLNHNPRGSAKDAPQAEKPCSKHENVC